MAELSGILVRPESLDAGKLRFGERIEALEADPAAPKHYIFPGFIDLHIHGGGGADCMDGEAAVRQMARFHAAHGTTALLATTVTAPQADIEAALRGINAVVQNPQPGEARVLGVHLEGPFISAKKLGAQPPYAIAPNIELMQHFMSLAPIKVITLAAELPGALELIEFLYSQGVRVQQGHTIATYEQAKAGFEAGARGFTHFFNAMTGLHHREPGVAGLALERSQWAEVITDGLHVHPGAVKAVWKTIPKTYAITDAVAAAGMPDGNYHLGRHTVIKKANGVYLENGKSLAGSSLTLDQAVRNLHSWGLGLSQIAAMTSYRASCYLGLSDIGQLEPGFRADFVVMNEGLEVEEVYIGGKVV